MIVKLDNNIEELLDPIVNFLKSNDGSNGFTLLNYDIEYLKNHDIFIEYDGENIFGLCLIDRRSNNLYEIRSLVIDVALRRNGIASRLIQMVSNEYPRLSSIISVDNTPAVMLLLKNDFKIYTKIDSFQIHNGSEYIMVNK